MRHFFASTTALFASALSAQITIGPADMPAAGDTVRYVTTDASAIDPASTEAGFLWDFGALVPDLEGADTCVSVGSTPILYQFYFNNPFIYPEYDADYAVQGQGFDFQGQLTVTDVYDYFKSDATGFRNVGFGANVNGVPASVRRIPVDWIHRFPMDYGDMDTSYSEFSLAIPTLGSFTEQQTRYNEVDGWGTLYLPADTFEVLRVKSTLQRADSVFIEQFGTGFAFDVPETIEYKWIAQGMDMPVLLIVTTAGQVTTARMYYDVDDITTGVATVATIGTGAYPNPADDGVSIAVPVEAGVITIRDVHGRVVGAQRYGAGSGTVRVTTADLAAGAYTATITGVTLPRTMRFMVEH